MTGPWREPAEETEGLYPGLIVCDNRVTGSITLGRSRLPVWCFWPDWPSWDDHATDQQEPGAPHYGVSKEDLSAFVHNLLEMRGEFARLLLVLADSERVEELVEDGLGPTWWEEESTRMRVVEQLRRCLTALGEE